MKRVSVAFFAATAAACVCAPASAGELFFPTNYGWSGLYLGGEIGGFMSDINGTFSTPPVHWNSGPTGGIGGGFVGYQQDFSGFVLGVEGNYLDSFNDSGSGTCHPAVCVPGLTSEGHLGALWTVGSRLGWNAGQFLPYASGGYANASIENDVVDSGGHTVDSSSNRVGGWYAGGGVDMALNSTWKIGVEYRHYEFDTITATPVTPLGVPVPGDRWSLDPSADTVTARMSVIFGGSREEAIPLK